MSQLQTARHYQKPAGAQIASEHGYCRDEQAGRENLLFALFAWELPCIEKFRYKDMNHIRMSDLVITLIWIIGYNLIR